MNRTKHRVSPLRKTLSFLNFVVALLIAAFATTNVTPLFGAFCGFAAYAAVSAVLAPVEAACFANNFGVLNDTPILHDFFAEFWGELLPLNSFHMDYQDPVGGSRAVKPGDKITIKKWKQSATVYNVGAGGYNTATDLTPGTEQMTVPSTARAVSAVLTAAEYRLLASGRAGGADYEAFKRKVQDILLFALGEDMITALFGVIVAADFPNYTVVGAGTMSRAKETIIEQKFFTRKVKLDMPQAVLAADTYREWVDDHQAIVNNTGDTSFQKPLLFSGDKASTVTPFRFRRTHVAMPDDADRGFAATRTAIVGAVRVPDEATFDKDPVSLSEIVEPKTGAAVQARVWKDAKTGTLQLDIASIFSFQKGQPEALERILAAEPA